MITPSPRIPCLRRDCNCREHPEQPALFEVDLWHRPKRAGKGKPGVKYAKFSPKTRVLCDDCIAAIHRLGIAVAPFPRPVRWRRSETGQPPMRLCEIHKEERSDAEDTDKRP